MKPKQGNISISHATGLRLSYLISCGLTLCLVLTGCAISNFKIPNLEIPYLGSILSSKEDSDTDSSESLDSTLKHGEYEHLWALCRSKAEGQLASRHTDKVKALQVINCNNSKEQRLVSIDANGAYYVWQIATSSQAKVIYTGKVPGPVEKLDIDRSSGDIAVSDGKKIYTAQPEHVLLELDKAGIKTDITELVFSVDRSHILIGGVDGKVYQLQINKKTDGIPERYIGAGTVVSALATHPAGRVFFSGDWSGRLSGWLNFDATPYQGEAAQDLTVDFKTQIAVKASTGVGEDDPIEEIAIDSSGEYLILTTQAGYLQLWQIRGFHKIISFQAHVGLIYSLAIYTNRTGAIPSIATSGRDGRVVVWQPKLKDPVPGVAREGSFEIVKEIALDSVSSLTFANESELYLGRDDGSVLKLEINKPDAT